VALAGAICRPGGGSTPQASDPVLIGAGDIADGFNLNLASSTATAVLLDASQLSRYGVCRGRSCLRQRLRWGLRQIL